MFSSRSKSLYKDIYLDKDKNNCEIIVKESYNTLKKSFRNGKTEGSFDTVSYGYPLRINSDDITDSVIKCAQNKLQKDHVKLDFTREKYKYDYDDHPDDGFVKFKVKYNKK